MSKCAVEWEYENTIPQRINGKEELMGELGMHRGVELAGRDAVNWMRLVTGGKSRGVAYFGACGFYFPVADEEEETLSLAAFASVPSDTALSPPHTFLLPSADGPFSCSNGSAILSISSTFFLSSCSC